MVSIAQDAQGEEYVTPWLEKAGVTFPTLIDRRNVIGKAFGLKYVPVGILLDDNGRLVRPVSVVDIGDEAFRSELEQWISSGRCPPAWEDNSESSAPTSLSAREHEADDHLQKAVNHLENRACNSALEELRKAVALDPENWLLRKQEWAIDSPESFYEGEVDYEWQKARIKAENDRMRSSADA